MQQDVEVLTLYEVCTHVNVSDALSNSPSCVADFQSPVERYCYRGGLASEDDITSAVLNSVCALNIETVYQTQTQVRNNCSPPSREQAQGDFTATPPSRTQQAPVEALGPLRC